MRNNLKDTIDKLQLSDIYSLMFFILYKTQDIPEYATVREMCYLLDGNNMTRLLTYFAGKTITIPTAAELSILINSLMLYNSINLKGNSFAEAVEKLENVTEKQKEKIVELYLKIIPVMKEYNIDRSQINKHDR